MAFMWTMFAVSGVLGLVAAVIGVKIVLHALRSSTREGVMCLLVPGYVVYYALKKFEHPRRRALLAASVASVLLAGLCVQFSTAFAPQPDADASTAFEGLEGFEDFGDFDELEEDSE